MKAEFGLANQYMYMMTHIYIYETWLIPSMNTYLFKPCIPLPIGDLMMQSFPEIVENIQGRFFDEIRTRLNKME